MDKCDHIVCDDNGKLLSASDFIAGRFNHVLRYCPTCDRYEAEIQTFAYCPKCGERIDWLCIEGARMKRLREEVVNNISEIIGKWPGDETDEEFAEIMREHMERD